MPGTLSLVDISDDERVVIKIPSHYPEMDWDFNERFDRILTEHQIPFEWMCCVSALFDISLLTCSDIVDPVTKTFIRDVEVVIVRRGSSSIEYSLYASDGRLLKRLQVDS